MEDLKQTAKQANGQPFSEDLLVVLYAISCFLPYDIQLSFTISIKLMEIINLLNQKKTSAAGRFPRPDLDQSLESLHRQVECGASPKLKQIIQTIEMMQKIMQMKDLIDAVNEMNLQNGPDCGSPLSSEPFPDLSVLQAFLPEDHSELLGMFQSFLHSSAADEPPEGKETEPSPQDGGIAADREESSSKFKGGQHP